MRYKLQYQNNKSVIIVDSETNSPFPLLDFNSIKLICKLLNDYDNNRKNITDIEYEEIDNKLIK